MIVADTDVLIDFLRGAEPMAERIAFELSKGFVATTAINAFELEAGAHGPRQKLAVDDLLGALHIFPLGRTAALRAGALHRDLASRGQGIGMADSLIAAICLEENGMLLTRKRKHFERVAGLKLSLGSVG
jgi:tRNA(fMet)-specific endonuclease VapC